MNRNRPAYSEKYTDEDFEYRHVIMPMEFQQVIPREHLMTETEWRNLGIQQSAGWINYMKHSPEQHIILFKKPLKKEE
ncbi:MAG: Cks1bp [Paramarteilia canceri]